MGRSIRWSLIGWFGLLLAGVVGTYGWLVHDAAARATWGGVDGALRGQARAILSALEFDAEVLGPPAPGAEPKVLGSGWELDLSMEFRGGMARDGYWALYAADGARIHAEGARYAADAPRPARVEGDGVVRLAGDLRECWLAGAPDGRPLVAVVGRTVAAEQARLAALSATLLATGVGVLALALLGGVWLARRSVAPIARMAATAGRISAQDLATRLDVADVPDELRGLAQAFNATLDRLAAAFEQQARFTADASHELRTPVAVIRTQAEAALRRDRPPAEYRAALEACLRAAERMTNTVEGLLTLARADAGAGLAAAEAVGLAPLVDAACEALRGPAAAAEVALRADVPADAVTRGDRALLADVVQNLVANAIRYNRPGGTVTVTAAGHAGTVELRVADTGIGIPADALPHLFERFYRVDPARSRAQGGSGLGLAIVAWIVRAHGGSVEVASTEGQGSTFTVRLPAAGAPAVASGSPHGAPAIS